LHKDNPVSDSARTTAALVGALTTIVGKSQVITDPALMEQYVVDWSRRFGGPALAVVRPADTAEVSSVLRACHDAGVPVLPQGGNTGLVGGSVPDGQPSGGSLPVVLTTRRLDSIGEVDHLAGQITVGAGVTLGDVRRRAAAAGWYYGVDLAARDSATIGGTVATNAGGIHVIAFGMTRAQVVGIEAVMADGTVLSHLSGMLKDNTGYDLGGLLCGSEGTLAVITAVRLRLHRPVGRTSVAMIGCASYADALSVMTSSVAPGVRLIAAEVVDEKGMELVSRISGNPWPLERQHPLVTLLEVADGGDASGFVDLDDAVIALDAAEQARLWEFRERQGEAFSALGVAHKLDVSVPLAVLADCADEIRAVVGSYPGVQEFGVFGHLADGNIHVEIYGPAPDDPDVDLLVFTVVARHGGSISAEHGVGRAKVDELPLCRSAAEIAAMRAIKAAWDPDGLMNPGVLFSR
jgi:FAD/FMN-containing dehydrogenase